MPVKELQFWTMLWCKKSSNPLTPKTIEIPHTPKPPFGDATLGCYYGDNKGDRISIIFHDPRSRIDLNWRLIFFKFKFCVLDKCETKYNCKLYDRFELKVLSCFEDLKNLASPNGFGCERVNAVNNCPQIFSA
jgi:hypothetical protein